LPGRAAALHDEAGSSLLRVIAAADGHPLGRALASVTVDVTSTDGAAAAASCRARVVSLQACRGQL
jgi:hypothetical protein